MFSTADVAGVVDVRVSDEIWGSDHFPVFLDLHLRRCHYCRKTFKIKTLRTDRTGFSNKLDGQYREFLTPENESMRPAGKNGFFYRLGIVSPQDSTPPVRHDPSVWEVRNTVLRRGKECNKAKDRRAAYKRWVISSLLEDLVAYKECCTATKKPFRRKKRKGFCKFVLEVNSTTS